MNNLTPLGEVAYLAMGSAPPGESYNLTGDGVPMIAGAGDYGKEHPEPKKWTTSPTQVTKVGDLIVCVRATIGDLNWADKEYCLGRGVAGIRPKDDRLDLRYAAYYIGAMKDRLARLGTGSTFLAIRRADLENFMIPLPPLPEQKRIAAILDKADAIRKKRKQAIELNETFLRSTFLEMFGDPVTNPKGWEIQKLVDLCVPKIGLKAGPFGSALKKESYTNFGFRIYGQEQVIAGTLSVGDYYISDTKFSQLSSCAVEPGDLLISLVGSIGNTLVVPDEFEPGIINPRLIRIRTNKDLLAPLYLQWVLKQDSLQNVLGRRSHGGTMPVLNASMLKELRIPVPPLAFQEEFLALLTKAESSFTTTESLDGKANDLFNSLVQRAFRGEL